MQFLEKTAEPGKFIVKEGDVENVQHPVVDVLRHRGSGDKKLLARGTGQIRGEARELQKPHGRKVASPK